MFVFWPMHLPPTLLIMNLKTDGDKKVASTTSVRHQQLRVNQFPASERRCRGEMLIKDHYKSEWMWRSNMLLPKWNNHTCIWGVKGKVQPAFWRLMNLPTAGDFWVAEFKWQCSHSKLKWLILDHKPLEYADSNSQKPSGEGQRALKAVQITN